MNSVHWRLISGDECIQPTLTKTAGHECPKCTGATNIKLLGCNIKFAKYLLLVKNIDEKILKMFYQLKGRA